MTSEVASEVTGEVTGEVTSPARSRRFAACSPVCPGDLYVVVRLRAAEGEERIVLDEQELLDARWMSAEEVEARCEAAEDEGKPLAGKVSRGNWEMIRHALEGARMHRRWRLQPHMHTCIRAVCPSRLCSFTCTTVDAKVVHLLYMRPGALIEGVTTVPSSKGVPTMLYRARAVDAV